jgi:hypothetical protein
MRCLILLSCYCVLGIATSSAQVLGIIGSSTAAGEGATTFDSSWVARTVLYYRNLGELTSYHDIAISGTTTWTGMPSSFVPPTGNPQPPSPDPTANVTRILQLGSNVVVVGYPTNDIVFGYTLTQYLSNLRTIYDSVLKAGKVCYITTTQPRNDIPANVRQVLLVGRDSILNEFPQRSLNFWDPVVDPATLGILTQYSAGDGIHLNNAGHAVIALVAENAGIMTQTPLPLTLTSFDARKSGVEVLLQWTTAFDGNGGPVIFEVQRSTDGNAFVPIYNTGTRAPLAGTWSWTDSSSPAAGIVFYRLRWVEGSTENFSKVVTIDNAGNNLALDRVYLSGNSQLVLQLQAPVAGTASIVVTDFSGRAILRKTYSGLPAGTTLDVDLPLLANGEYLLRIVTSDGKQAARPFVKW